MGINSNNSIYVSLLYHIAVLSLSFTLIIGCVIYTQINRTMITLRDSSLTENAHDIASYIERSGDNTLYLHLPGAVRKFYAQAGKMRQYVVRDSEGNILFTSPIAFSDRFPGYFNEENHFFEFTGPYGTRYLGLNIRHEFEGQEYLVQVAQSEETAESFSNQIAFDFLFRVVVIGLPFTVLLVLLVYFSLRQSLKPLKEASRQARSISFREPGARIDESILPEEIRPFVRAMNYSLERLETGIKAQQEFTANVSHELKTPLTIMRSRIEAIEDKATADELAKDIDDLICTVNQMLELSRLDFPEAIKMAEIDLVPIVRNICQDMWPLFIAQGRELSVSGADGKIRIKGNADLIYRAVRNLLNNALVHSPAKTPVEVLIDERGVSVRDYGSRIQDAKRKQIFRRFNRDDHQKFRQGSGLGLSIVAKTMEIHGGLVLLEDPESGDGNVFRLEFP